MSKKIKGKLVEIDYLVEISFSGTETFIVSATSEEEAIESALEQARDTGDIRYEIENVEKM